ncbi:MAG TPA: DUF547 domain-containing protein [Candidatus Paceibacterota bacterium]|nr:DUF547 domain-containing protein [Candidatus Paceibacterota bacterium]
MTNLLNIRVWCALALGCVIAASSAAAAEFDQTQALFDQVLKTYVKDARVDYVALKAHPQDLTRYLDQVAAVTKPEFKQWNEQQQIAFLLNAYNAYTLKLIIDHYPIASIKDIGHFWSGPWDQPIVHLFGETTTLSTVENKMLRADYNEPRVHFAMVCASIGCPPLRSEAYVGSRLDDQLSDQARQFMANRTKNRVDVASHTIYLSPIFKWFAGDFEKKSGSVLAFLKPYWPDKERAELANGDFAISYTDYDWSLNKQGK